MARVTGLNHVTLVVSDVERSFEFYRTVLGFEPVARWKKGAYLEAGDVWLALILSSDISERTDYSHIAFSCSQAEFGQLREALEAAGAQTWSQNVSEGDSFYFLDPDGHRLELHVGDLETRLRSMREKPWDKIRFYRDQPD